MSATGAAAAGEHPEAPLFALDVLWFHVAGSLCNLECRHCFVSASPTNHRFGMLDLATVKRHLRDAEHLGVKEYYFTGGEPFLNPEILPILEAALGQGPVSVLTNGLLIRSGTARALRRLWDGSPYSLDVRISVDGWDAASNDPIRGEGSFERILAGVRHLAAAGLNPVITVTEACQGAASSAGRARFLDFLREIGLPKPRLKVMPLLRLGAETGRTRAYAAWENLRGRTLSRDEAAALGCSSGRIVTSEGVSVCPILVDSPEARMGSSLEETLRPFRLSHSACYTCHAEGLSCRT